MAEASREQREAREKGGEQKSGERQVSRREHGGALAPWSGSPFGFMRRFVEEMDRLFDDVRLGGPLTPRIETGSRAGAWVPQMDVVERDDKLVVRADLPGLKKEDVDVEVRDDLLCISGERRREEEREQGGVYRQERSYGGFCRTMQLPGGVDPQQVKATFATGVLEVQIPLPKRPAGRRVQIQDTSHAA